MTKRLLVLALILAASSLLATEIRTTTGAVYKNARVSRVEPDGIMIIHSAGVTKVPFTELPVEVQRQYVEGRAAMERKATAEAAFANRVAEFKKDAADLLANTSLPASDFQELRILNDVKELPAATQKKISALDEKVRTFREKDDAERFIEACRADIGTISALQTRAKIAREIHGSNAAAALTDVNSFFQDNSPPPSDPQKNLWRSLVSIRNLCDRLEKESKTHLERAQSLSASGKPGEAIQEFQEAYRIFPDPTVAETIKQLREASLGL